MGILKTGISAIGKLLVVIALGAAFVVGAVSAVYLSLRGDEVKVPEIVGKDFYSSENDMAALGLKIKKRATRYSQEKPNTILEQLPKPGETVKSGQIILVVTSEASPEGSEAPATVNKDTADDAEESTDVTPDKPVNKNSNKNSNTKKPAQTTRDVISNKSNANANTASNVAPGNSSGNTKPETGAGNKNSSTTPSNKVTPPANLNKIEPAKPAAAKPTPATSGDMRTRRVP